ncbi:hypothetical protein [Novosphingobium sp. 9U]|uniref:hypothetical protein n=1 Tax=Novosphingobium sp. 9U TaxID=2653158 RepID=UPI00135CA5DF|nr:hypothetical protein [Novosphingobium sp. 9U]
MPLYTAPLIARRPKTRAGAVADPSAGSGEPAKIVTNVATQQGAAPIPVLMRVLTALALALCLLLAADHDARFDAPEANHLPRLIERQAMPPPSPGGASPERTEYIYPLTGWLFALFGGAFFAVELVRRVRPLIERRRRRRLRRDTDRRPEAVTQVAVREAQARLFADPALGGALRKLRRHRAVPSTRLDARASIRATIAAGAIPTMRFAQRRLSPDYLLVSERERPQDHLGVLAQSWYARLLEAGISCSHYEFFGDPNTVRPADAAPPDAEPLDVVIGRHPGADLMVLMEAYDAIPVAGTTPRWLERVQHGAAPYHLNPRPPASWATPELRLDALGVKGFAADPGGVAALADWIDRTIDEDAIDTPVRAPGELDLAAFLAEHRAMLLSAVKPTDAQVATVVDTLRAWLDKDAFDWLCAVAVFPIVNVGFTLFAGCALKDRPMLTHARYLSLARLPWLRAGTMPDWLRQALAGAMTPRMAARAAATAAAFLLPPRGSVADAAALVELRRAAEQPRARGRLARRLELGGHPVFNDRLLIEALKGGDPGILGVALSGEPEPLPAPTWRRPEVLAAIGGVLLMLALIVTGDPLQMHRKPLFGLKMPEIRIGPGYALPPETRDPASEVTATPTQEPTNDGSDPSNEAIDVGVAPTPSPSPSDAAASAITLYIQIPSQSLRARASQIAAALGGQRIDGLHLSIPAVEYRPSESPRTTQLRCFSSVSCGLADRIAMLLVKQQLDVRVVLFRPADLRSLPASPDTQVELWFGSDQASAVNAPDFPKSAPVPIAGLQQQSTTPLDRPSPIGLAQRTTELPPPQQQIQQAPAAQQGQEVLDSLSFACPLDAASVVRLGSFLDSQPKIAPRYIGGFQIDTDLEAGSEAARTCESQLEGVRKTYMGESRNTVEFDYFWSSGRAVGAMIRRMGAVRPASKY